MILQKIISVILVVCLLAALTTSASAVDIYSTTPEAEPLLKAPILMSTYNGGISTAAVEPSDLSNYLSAVYKSYNRTVAELLAIIAGYLDVSDSSFVQLGDAVYTVSQLFGDLNDSLLVGVTQSYLDRYGSISRSSLGLGGFIVDGIMGLAVKIDSAVTSINSVLNNVVSGLSTVNTSVGTVNTSVGIVNSSLNSLLKFPAGYSVLGNNGTAYTSSVALPLVSIVVDGLNGLSRNIKGYEADNTYTSSYYDNNNSSTSSDVAGLGPMLNYHFNSLGENLGHLAYVFASDDEIKLKQDSEPIMEEVGSIYDDSDSKVKVNADGIGSVKNVVGAFGDFLDTDSGIDDVITIVTNPNSYSWLTRTTLNNLDSVGVTTFSRGESWHDKLYNEFYTVYFPERE